MNIAKCGRHSEKNRIALTLRGMTGINSKKKTHGKRPKSILGMSANGSKRRRTAL